jgi:hypothetical protein
VLGKPAALGRLAEAFIKPPDYKASDEFLQAPLEEN